MKLMQEESFSMTIDSIVTAQRNYFHSDITKDISFRQDALKNLLSAIKENENSIYDALNKDLGKSEHESYMTEVGLVINAIHNAISNLDKWSKPQKCKTPISHFPAKSYIYKEPYGVVLIMSPWNYPFYLTMSPLIGAIAAGNCAVIKTSRNSIHTSAIIQVLVNNAFSSNYVRVLDTQTDYDEILSCRYDYIFFTGSERVGRIVMRHASDNLTPVTLELGGKSPCIIDRSANLKLAAKRIAWGKILNAGQTCIAPDYVVVPSDMKDRFVSYLQEYFHQFLNSSTYKDYGKIINLHHFIRIKNMIGKASSVIGGKMDEKSFRIEPAVFTDATFNDDIMRNEIFGPILPVISYDDLDEVLDIIKHRPKPLACYIFGKKQDFLRKVNSTLSFGGGCINDTMIHVTNEDLPFGGVGSSGMGSYHGKHSFDTFSHKKSILINGSIDFPFRYPPYSDKKKKIVKTILK